MWEVHDEFCIEEVFRNKRKKGKDVPPGLPPGADRWLVDTHTGEVLGVEDTCYWLGYRDGANWLLHGMFDEDIPERLARLRAHYEATCPADADGGREWTLDGDHEGIIVAVEGLDANGERDADGRLIAAYGFFGEHCEWSDPDSPESWDHGVRGFVEGIMATYWRLRWRLGLRCVSPPSNN
jgi:hypothetical protein